MSNLPRPLSKTALQQGAQCPRMLWIRYNMPWATNSDYDPADQAQFEIGNIVGEAAQNLYDKDERVTINTSELGFSPEAYSTYVAQTQAAMDDPSINCIAEAAFYYDDVIVFVDLLVRAYDEYGEPIGWSIYEVKASSMIAPHQVRDALWQAHIADLCGCDLVGIYLLHPARGTTAFVEDRAGQDFEVVDMWSDWLYNNYRNSSIDDEIEEIKDMVVQEEPPACEGTPGRCECCHYPYDCVYTEKCQEIFDEEMGYFD